MPEETDYIEPEEERVVANSIAEMSLIETMIMMSNLLLDEIREARAVLEKPIISMDEIISKVRKVKEKIEEQKERAMEYLVRLPPGLIMKDTFGPIILGLTNVSQYVDGSMYRLALLAEKGATTEKLTKVTNRLLSLLYDQVEYMNKAIKVVQRDPLRALKMINESIRLEDEIDREYRSNLYEVLSESDAPASAVLTWEILSNLEDASDIAKDAAEYFKYFVLHKV